MTARTQAQRNKSFPAVGFVGTRSIGKDVVRLDVFGNDICNGVSVPARHAKVTDKRAVASLATREKEARDKQ
jgi:nitrogenase subunit NifH